MAYIDPQTIEKVKQIDLLTYLTECDPNELVKISPTTYATKTHDSLKVSNGKWYWWSRGIGGKSALDYLIKVRNMRFLDAVKLLQDRSCLPAEITGAVTAPEARKPVPFRLPPINSNNDNAINYLTLRGIDARVIEDCLKAGIIYETKRQGLSNLVFVGLDTGKQPRYAALRGCRGVYKGEVAGSDKRHSFKLNADTKNPKVHIFEGAIDLLSYATLMLNEDKDWREMNLLSLGGIPPASKDPTEQRLPQAIAQYLADNPYTKSVCLHLDNDEPGRVAASAIASILSGQYEVDISHPEKGKDVNEYLMLKSKNRFVDYVR